MDVSIPKEFKVMLIGDVHFQLSNVLETDIMTEEIIRLILIHSPGLVVVLGDVLHTHDKVNLGPLVRAIKFLERIRDISNHLVVLIGNHDRPNNADFLTDNHAFTALKSWPKTTIVDKVCKIELEGISFLAVPYVPVGRLSEALASEKLSFENDSLNSYSSVFLHQEIMGSKMGAIVSEHGDIWPPSAPQAFSGHVHDFDELLPNMIHVGTPIQHGFADKPDKAVMIAHYKSENEGIFKYQRYERFRLNVPMKVHVKLTVEELCVYQIPPNVHIKITIVGDPVEIRRVLALETVKTMLARPGVKYTISDTRPTISQAIESTNYKPVRFQEKLLEVLQAEPTIVRDICTELRLIS